MKEALKIAGVVLTAFVFMVALPLFIDSLEGRGEVKSTGAAFGCNIGSIGKGMCVVTCSFAAGASCTCKNGGPCHCHDASGGHQEVKAGDVCP